MYWHASLESLKLRNLAVGMPWRDMNSLENSLLASIWAALAVGPKQGIPSQGGAERESQSQQERARQKYYTGVNINIDYCNILILYVY